jgi:hypothetical protein
VLWRGLRGSLFPNTPLIHKARTQRKFVAAYFARRSFLEEVAAVIGGHILVLDESGLQNVVGAEVVRRPTPH